MKKTLGVVAAAALAAMPVVGVFAADPTAQSSVKDSVSLTVTKTCQMLAEAAERTVDLGSSTVAHQFTEKAGAPITITCNSTAGWNLKATATSMERSAGDAKAIPFGTYASTGNSVWSAKIVSTGGTVATGWGNYEGATASDTTVVSGNSVSGITVTPSYKAYANATQEEGTYTGTMTYTLVDLAAPGA